MNGMGESSDAAAPAGTRIDEAVQLVGFPEDNSPLFIDLQQAGLVASGLPILSSRSATRPEFDPITYGTDAAVAKWAGDIHATASGKIGRASCRERVCQYV